VVNALDTVGAVFLRPNTYGAGTGVNYNPERLKLVWDDTAAGGRCARAAARERSWRLRLTMTGRSN
jgi:hypothetical protein